MDEFLMVASHEFRTPLTVALGNVQLAAHRLGRLRGWDGAQEARLAGSLREIASMLDRTDNQMRRLTRLNTELLDVSRIQADRFAFDLMPCELAALLSTWVHDQCDAAPGRAISLNLPADTPVTVQANPDRLEQVITNYLTNALKYSPEGSPVAISLRVEGAQAIVGVRDHGPGLSAQEQERIWERFYRVPGAVEQNGSSAGLGLGLYISRMIIEQHHGRVGVESAVGAGSTFWFALPLSPAVA
jgi:signal transduction histidine kinase